MNLTEEQLHILDNCHKPIFINAGPGSGKSTMLGHISEKILSDDQDSRILLLTFTNKAAKSIMSKCSTLDQSRILGGTFHGICYKILRENNKDQFICDESKKRLIIKKVFNCKKDKEKFEYLYDKISNLKSNYPLTCNDSDLNKYQNELHKYKLLDFDDIIINIINSLKQKTCGAPSVTHILVDELQDTSGQQLELLKELYEHTKAIMLGASDLDQCIYSWRNARPQNTRDFIHHFGCSVYNMGINFRSNKSIVDCSACLIRHNKDRLDKKLEAFNKEKGVVTEYKCLNPFNEIDYVIMKCKQNRGKEIAILYRNRSFKNHLEFELRKEKIEYKVNDFLEITDRSAIKVMMSVLKICTRSYDIYDLTNAAKAIKRFGIGTVNKLEEESKEKQEKVNIIVTEYTQDKKKRNRLNSIIKLQEFFDSHQEQNLELLIREVEKYFNKSFDYQDEMRAFLLDISREYKITTGSIKRLHNELGLTGNEEHNDKDALVELSTLHGYKGLERDIVILPWCDDYLTPKPGKKINEEEERRLFYVGATRARAKLYMSYSGDKPKFIKEMKV